MTIGVVDREPTSPQGDVGWREEKKRRTREALHAVARQRVLDVGLAAVTVEGICAEAGVSARTFFNYFPSKAAAAVGLPDLAITDEQRDRFLAATGNPVRDLCELVADVVRQAGERLSEKAHIRDLLQARPEVRPEMLSWLAETRRRFAEVAEERMPARPAKVALAVVMTALGDLMESSAEDDRDLADRLWAAVLEMTAIVLEQPADAGERADAGGTGTVR